MRTLMIGVSLWLLAASTALASPNCTLPYTLQNGQTADATQVMADFSALVACVGTAASAGANSDITSLNGLTSPVPTPGGFLNKFRNGTMDVWQRGTSVTATTSGNYTADGWIVVPTGASVSAQQAPGRQLTAYSLQVIGAPNVSDVVIKQRIESLIAAPLSGQTVTVQAEVYNNTGVAIVPTLTVKHANSADNWSSPIIDVNAASLQSAANGQWTQIAYTFTASASSAYGLEISFDFGNNFGSNSQSVQLTELDLRVTAGATTGLNSNPPPPELRPIGAELPLCQRYFSGGTEPELLQGAPSGVTVAYSTISLPATMRVAPTMTLSGWEYFSGGTPTPFTPSLTSIGTDYFSFGSSSLTNWGGWFAVGTWTASAEL